MTGKGPVKSGNGYVIGGMTGGTWTGGTIPSNCAFATITTANANIINSFIFFAFFNDLLNFISKLCSHRYRAELYFKVTNESLFIQFLCHSTSPVLVTC